VTVEEQVLVYTPTGRDAALACQFLATDHIESLPCHSMDELCERIGQDAAAALIAEEALTPGALARLVQAIDAQPAWSDIPLIVLTGREFATSAARPLAILGQLRNVMILERPVRQLIFARAVAVALRSRRRQLELRAHLASRANLLRREQELNRMKDEFLMTVSHELRTPLTAIFGWARMLATGEIRESQRQRAAEIIERNASAQAQIVNDLLDVARAMSGKTRLDMRPVDLRQVVEAAVDTVQPGGLAKGVRIDVDVDSSCGLANGDPDRLQQVVWNLLSNAVKFTPPGGVVQVAARPASGACEIVVTDNGAGIDPEFLPYVFDNFRQGDAGTTRMAGGLGLGLTIVRHLVELHGGSVQATSEGQGKGATFRVLLPVAAASCAVPSEGGPRQQIDVQSLDGRRVLVLDDDAGARELFAAILERAGAEVRVAGFVDEAMEVVERFRPEAILSDIEMPVHDGYSLIPRLRAAGVDPPIVVALTAHARSEDRHRALREGFAAHIAKPVDPRQLVLAVAALFRSKAAAASDEARRTSE
jgi:signal transduction histidine kinase/ActR/RegA family two-component response regulator